jgi:HEAT repeat protein
MPFLRSKMDISKIEKMTAKLDIKGLIDTQDSNKYGQDIAQAAMEALVSIGSPAVEPLILSLNGKNDFIFVNSTFALRIIRDARGLRALVSALQTQAGNTAFRREQLVKAIKILPDQNGIFIDPLCTMAISSSEPELFVRLLESYPNGVTALCTRLKSQSVSERRGAVYALRFVDSKENRVKSVDPLRAALGDKDYLIRSYAAEALFRNCTNIKDIEADLFCAYENEKKTSTKAVLHALLTNYDQNYRSAVSES